MHDENADVPATEVDSSIHAEARPIPRSYGRRWYKRMPQRLHIGALRYMGGYEEGEFRVPSLRLRGLWLFLLGFKAGTWVTIAYDGKSLILTPEEPPAAP
jgi:hypothetical protein